MKIAMHSDLHIEGYRLLYNTLSDTGYDVLVLAGDIVSAKTIDRLQVLREKVPTDKPVIFVPGNHEFYGGCIKQTANELRDKCSELGFIYADRKVVVIDEVVFICATGWATLDSFHEYSMEEKWLAMKSCIADFQAIKSNSVDDMIERGKADYEFIKSNLELYKDHKCVVVTHFSPSETYGNQNFDVTPISSYFSNDWTHLMYEYQPVFWVYGHTHGSVEGRIYRTRVVTNQRGYGHECFATYNENKIIEVNLNE